MHVLLYFSVVKLILIIYPIKFILKMTNNIKNITSLPPYKNSVLEI